MMLVKLTWTEEYPPPPLLLSEHSLFNVFRRKGEWARFTVENAVLLPPDAAEFGRPPVPGRDGLATGLPDRCWWPLKVDRPREEVTDTVWK